MQGVFDFTDDEIRAELRRQGYVDLPAPRLAKLREDLKQLIAHEQKNSSATSDPSATSLSTSQAASSLHDESASLGRARPATSAAATSGWDYSSRQGLALHDASVNTFASRPEAAAHVDKENAGTGAARNSGFGHKTYRQLLLPRDGRQSPPAHGAFQSGQRAKFDSVASSAGSADGHAVLRPVQQQQQLRSAAASSLQHPHGRHRAHRDPAAVGGGDDWHGLRQHASSADRAGDTSDDVDDQSEDLPSFIKRKVLRKRGGRSEICDESIATSTSDADNVSALSERLFRMPALNEMPRHRDNPPAAAKSMGVLAGHLGRRPDTPDTSSSLGPRRSTASVRAAGSTGNACRSSVIIPCDPPQSARTTGRCDPVRRHLEYERLWAAQRTTEERQQKGLRWRVRERMLVRDVVYQKRQWMYQPNSYEVPTSKQRKALRWQVRADMAHGVLPLTGRKA